MLTFVDLSPLPTVNLLPLAIAKHGSHVSCNQEAPSSPTNEFFCTTNTYTWV